MNYSEVKKELKKEFESFLKPLGYKTKTDTQGCEFTKLTDFGNQGLGYGIANYINEFSTALYIGTSILRIQKIAVIILGDSDFHCNLCSTIGSGTNNYFNETNYRFKIESEKDIIEWGKIARKFYEEFAVPFFEKYNSVDAIDKLLNENPTEKVIYLDDLAQRIIKGLIAAKLNNNPNYTELMDYYQSEVESKLQGYFMYEKCMKTIHFLGNHTQEELNEMAENPKVS